MIVLRGRIYGKASALGACSYCEGERSDHVRDSDERGVICVECDRTKDLEAAPDCAACDGVGEIVLPSKLARCAFCRGTGKSDRDPAS